MAMASRMERNEESMIVDGIALFDFHLKIVGECTPNPDGDGMTVLSKAGRRYIMEIVAPYMLTLSASVGKFVLFIDFGT